MTNTLTYNSFSRTVIPPIFHQVESKPNHNRIYRYKICTCIYCEVDDRIHSIKTLHKRQTLHIPKQKPFLTFHQFLPSRCFLSILHFSIPSNFSSVSLFFSNSRQTFLSHINTHTYMFIYPHI